MFVRPVAHRHSAVLARKEEWAYTSLQHFLSCKGFMERVLIIADDLTGALDSACAFAARGLPTRVILEPKELRQALADQGAQVLAVATGTRELSGAVAGQISEDICAQIQGFTGIVFKKVDSRLKGNIAVELAPLARAFPRPILACPAIPAQGRVTRDGCVSGAGVAQPIAVAPALGLAAEVPDCSTDAELDSVLLADLKTNLYVGAAGLAAALARRLAPAGHAVPFALPKPLILAVGSRDPITLSQVAKVPGPIYAAPNGVVSPLRAAAHLMVQLVAGREVIDGATAANAFADGIVEQIERLDPKSLFACGGETAHAILRKLGCLSLDLWGEVLPGVPVAYCPARDLVVLTKSGGFGGPDLLVDLLSKFDKSTEERITTL